MAEIKKIVRSAPLSNFRQAAPDTGGAFRFLADTMAQGYDFLLPAAKAEMETRGGQVGRDLARQQIGNPAAITASSMGATADGGVGASANWVTEGLVARGMAPHVAEGFARNFHDESGLNPNAVGDNGNAFGVAQWNGPRKASLEAFAANAGKPPSDRNVQLDFLMSELQGPEAGAWSQISSAQNANDAAVAVLNSFERPAEVHRARREAAYRGGSTTVSTSEGPYVPPTMLRTADGTLQARMYSPLSGPLLQISNAAAGVAYQSDVMLKSAADLMDIANQFPLNPEGYRAAATAYVDDLVKAAPEMFRNDIRSSAENMMNQRFLGMIEDKQRDTRQRADNSSSALADRYSDDLAQAVATGNPEAIAAAQANLSSILMARETLPGIAWTPEQSQNVMIKAHEAGMAMAEKARKEADAKIKASFSLISSAAMNGRAAADESMLNDPAAQAADPEGYRRAAASVMLRDQMPSFMKMTPAEQQQALAEMKTQPITAQWENDLYGAAERAAAANAAAWEKDPIKQAGTVLEQKPPALPTVEQVMQNPQSVVDAIGARVAYGQGLKDKGFVDFTAFFTDEEAATYGALFGKDTPPEIKALLAGAVVAGAGKSATSVFKELKSDDPVTLMSGMLMARSGDTVTPTMAMKGQAMLDQGLVQPPTKATTMAAISPDLAMVFASLPPNAASDTMKMATAIYASQVPANGLDDKHEKTLMESSVQMALGQTTNKAQEKTGGVQTIGAAPVLLPPGVSGVKLNGALDKALGKNADFFSLQTDTIGNPDIWTAAGAVSAPMLGGAVLDKNSRDRATLTPLGGSMYAMHLKNPDGSLTDVRDANGGLFIFDVSKLIGAAK